MHKGVQGLLARGLLLYLLPLATACSFLLDFDKLQQGKPDAGNASGGHGGTHNSGGSAGSLLDATMDASTAGAQGGNTTNSDAAMDAAVPCATDCDDHDPCTTDRCTAGQCVSTPTAGIIDDGFSQTLIGDNIYRAALVAGADRFYLAAYGNLSSGDAGARQDIALYSIPASGDTWSPGPEALQLKDFGSQVVISPAGVGVGRRGFYSPRVFCCWPNPSC